MPRAKQLATPPSMNFHNFRIFAAVLLTAVFLPEVPAATPGPEVAVMEILVGRERQPRHVVIGLYDDAAPLTVENFKNLARRRFYNGIRFHRIFPGTLVQTGDPLTRVRFLAPRMPLRAGTGGPGFTLPPEIREKHIRGSVAMARLPDAINPARLSNGSQFYITLAAEPSLDGKFTVFGEVLEGLDVLDEISNLPADSNDFPLPRVLIRSIRIVPRLAEAGRP